MKKLLFVFAIAAIGTLASCKKDYTCTCVVNNEIVEISINDSKEDDADDACDRHEDDYQANDPEADCDID